MNNKTKEGVGKVAEFVGQGLVGAVIMTGIYVGVYSQKIQANEERIQSLKLLVNEIRDTRFKRSDAEILEATIDMKMRGMVGRLSDKVDRMQGDVKSIIRKLESRIQTE
jgi:hypothetical protein